MLGFNHVFFIPELTRAVMLSYTGQNADWCKTCVHEAQLCSEVRAMVSVSPLQCFQKAFGEPAVRGLRDVFKHKACSLAAIGLHHCVV